MDQNISAPTATVAGIAATSDIQYICLDFDGELAQYRNGELGIAVDNVAVEDSRLTAERINAIVVALNDRFADQNVQFVTERPAYREYSTVYVGKTSAFDEYGNFVGLAETVDRGNKNRSDNAFVMLDAAFDNAEIVDVIAHETEHLLGTLDHGGDDLEKYAYSICDQGAYVQRNLGIYSSYPQRDKASAYTVEFYYYNSNNKITIYEDEIAPTFIIRTGFPINVKFDITFNTGFFRQDGTVYFRIHQIYQGNKSVYYSKGVDVSLVTLTYSDKMFDQAQEKKCACVIAATVNALGMLGKAVGGSYDTLLEHYGDELIGDSGCGLGIGDVLADGGLANVKDFSMLDGADITYDSLKEALDNGFAVIMRYDNEGSNIGHAVTVDSVRKEGDRTIVKYTDSGDNASVYREAELRDGKLYIDGDEKNGVGAVVVKNADNWKIENLTDKKIISCEERQPKLANAKITRSGVADIDDGGSIDGVNSIYGGRLNAGNGVSAASGAGINVYLAYESPSQTPVIGNLDNLSGASVSVKVESNQTPGRYGIASNAANYSGTISVDASDLNGGEGASVGSYHTVFEASHLGDLRPGDEIRCGTAVYRLELDSDAALILTVGYDAVPGDLNGDGRADVVMTITQTTHPHVGATGAWLIQENQTAAWGDLSQRNAGWSIFGKGFTTAGKTTADVYLKSDGNVVGAWTTDTTGKVTGWTTVGEFDSNTQVLGLGDFNGDGQTDLLLRNTNGAVGCHLTDGTGWHYFQSLGSEWKIAAVGDLNGDGRDDVVLKHDAGFAGSWLTQRDCTMAWADLDTLPSGYSIVGTGDFDGDGTDDVLLKNGNYYGAWLVRNGNAAGWFGIGDLGNVAVEEIADFDSDGKDDLRIRTAAGDLGAQLVKGADTLQWKYYGSVGAEWSTTLAAI